MGKRIYCLEYVSPLGDECYCSSSDFGVADVAHVIAAMKGILLKHSDVMDQICAKQDTRPLEGTDLFMDAEERFEIELAPGLRLKSWWCNDWKTDGSYAAE